MIRRCPRCCTEYHANGRHCPSCGEQHLRVHIRDQNRIRSIVSCEMDADAEHLATAVADLCDEYAGMR